MRAYSESHGDRTQQTRRLGTPRRNQQKSKLVLSGLLSEQIQRDVVKAGYVLRINDRGEWQRSLLVLHVLSLNEYSSASVGSY